MKECVSAWLKSQTPDIDEAMLAVLYSEYRETVARLSGELRTARAEGAGFERLDRVAHTLKGTAAMMGDLELFEAVQAWRAALKAGDQAGCDALWPEVERLQSEI